MELPKFGVPEFYTDLPSTGEKIKFRPFTVKEQKALLFASSSGGEADAIIDAIEKVINGCLIDVDVKNLAAFDYEYLFLKIRGKSVGENIKFYLRHGKNNPCEHRQEYELNLDDVTMSMPSMKNTIMFNESMGVTMKYPNFRQLVEFTIAADNPVELVKFVGTCIESIFTDEDVYTDFTNDEIQDWMEGLPTQAFDQMTKWLENLPTLTHKITYVCDECGQEETVTLRGISDFFTYA